MVVEHLDDVDDPRLADYAHLREPGRRMGMERARGIFTVEGRLSLEALLTSPYEVRSVLVSESYVERLGDLVPRDVDVLVLPSRVIEQISGVHFHRGVLAVGERPEPASVEQLVRGASRVLVLEAVNDHENIGALFRNAAAFGVEAVVLDPTSADPLYRRATRVSLGHVLRVPFARVADGEWPSALSVIRDEGIEVLALTPAVDAERIGSVAAARPARAALMVGAEGPGLTDAAMDFATCRVRIPMVAGVDSVNVATAAAIALSALHGHT